MSGALQQLTELTGFALRTDYADLLSAYPQQLRDLVRADDGSDAEGHVHNVELMCDPGDLLEINHEVRNDQILDPEGNDFWWPDQVMAIGETGDGDYYAIDLADEYHGVLYFDHQLMEFEEITESLEEFVQLLMETFAA